MDMNDLKGRLPEPAKDLRLNLGSLLEGGTSLDSKQLHGTLLACALAVGEADLISAVASLAREQLDDTHFDGARSAAALMAMNNVYYRSLHLMSNEGYGTMPARLRMQRLASHGCSPVDFELWCLAVSAVNGCGRCLDAHENTLLKKGARAEQIQDALRVASVLHAVGRTLQAERALESALGASASA